MGKNNQNKSTQKSSVIVRKADKTVSSKPTVCTTSDIEALHTVFNTNNTQEVVMFNYANLPSITVPADNSAHNFLNFLTSVCKVKLYRDVTRVQDRVLISNKACGGGALDKLLARPEGATMEELQAVRGAVPAHLAALRRKGFVVRFEGGRYYAHA